MVVYQAGSLHTDRIMCIDEHNPYFQMLRSSWGDKLRQMFDSIEDPMWNGGATDIPLMVPAQRNALLKKITTPEEKLI
jgi:putative proteasome-type protease